MISKLKLILLCPVPEDQKPISEYIGLIENPLTNWTTLSPKNYNAKIFSIFCSIFTLVSTLTFFEKIFFGDWIIANLIITTTLLITFYFVLIWRWSEIKKRLNQSRLFYEEASWYDGQIWEKPFIILKNDRLLMDQKVSPVIRRLIKTQIFLIYLNILLLILS